MLLIERGISMTFEELYQKVIAAKAKDQALDLQEGSYSKGQLDCILHPDKHPMILKKEDCDCTDPACVSACIFTAMEIKDGNVVIRTAFCVGCEECIIPCR